MRRNRYIYIRFDWTHFLLLSGDTVGTMPRQTNSSLVVYAVQMLFVYTVRILNDINAQHFSIFPTNF